MLVQQGQRCANFPRLPLLLAPVDGSFSSETLSCENDEVVNKLVRPCRPLPPLCCADSPPSFPGPSLPTAQGRGAFLDPLLLANIPANHCILLQLNLGGFVVTDWGAAYHTKEAALAGTFFLSFLLFILLPVLPSSFLLLLSLWQLSKLTNLLPSRCLVARRYRLRRIVRSRFPFPFSAHPD